VGCVTRQILVLCATAAALLIGGCSSPSEEEKAWNDCVLQDMAQRSYADVDGPTDPDYPSFEEAPEPRRPSPAVLVFEGEIEGVRFRCTYNKVVENATTFEWLGSA
jgi:hypothetical protein